MNSELTFESIDSLKRLLKNIYISGGLDEVKEWIEENMKRGKEVSFKINSSNTLDDKIVIWDRNMEILDPMSNKSVNPSFLPLISSPVDYNVCDMYLSLRILFISEPFGVVIYKRKQT